jgi:Ca2+-binding RTX toxin-like protein
VTVNLGLVGAQTTGGSGTDTISGFENLDGGAGGDRLTGSGSANVIAGGAGKDTLKGAAGADVLVGNQGDDSVEGGVDNDLMEGGIGADTVAGGAGVDAFRFAAPADGGDRLTDFASGTDKIQVVSANFARLAAGALPAGRFRADGTSPTNGRAVFLYDSVTGILSFDVDGNGTGLAVPLATLTGAKVLIASDIEVVAS